MTRKIALAACLLLAAGAAHAALRPGAKAPDFQVEGALAGKDFRFSLADALRKGPVVLYFYPKSFTSVCTEEAHLFAEAAPQFAAAGATVIGLSGDDIATQRKFSTMACRDTFAVGADADLKVARAYDASFSGMFAARISYVVAPDGSILSALSSSEAEPHVRRTLEAVRAWKAGQKS